MANSSSKMEKVSCFMDGETDAPIEWLCRDADATAGWQRYHLIRDILRDGRPSCLSKGFADRVMQALEQEPTIISPRLHNRTFRSPVLKPLAGLAIAATVAAVTVMGIQNFYRPGTTAPAALTADNGTQSDRAAITQHTLVSARTEPTAAQGEEEIADENLNSYLLEHVEQSTGGHIQGMLPYVRLAGYENTR